MKLIGWCTECRKVKRVTVSGHGMATLATGRVAHGVCDECEEEKRPRRRT